MDPSGADYYTDRFPEAGPIPNPNPSAETVLPPSANNVAVTAKRIPHPRPSYNPLLSMNIPKRPRRGLSHRNIAAGSSSRLDSAAASGSSDISCDLKETKVDEPRSAMDGHASAAASGSSDISCDLKETKVDEPRSAMDGHASDASEEIIVISRDVTTEALTALSVGFLADTLIDEEIEFGVVPEIGGIKQINYILIRNHIISKWRADATSWVSKEMFVDVVPRHCHEILDSAYDYLVSHGYVNFGVAPNIKEKIPLEPTIPKSVIIIGAGLAGLGAARQLMRFGFRVTVLEGRKRAGGRVYTKRMVGGNASNRLIAAADLGGSVLTSTLGNPLGILAQQKGYLVHKVREECPLYKADGTPVNPDLDTKVEIAFNKALDKASDIRQMMGDIGQNVSLGSAVDAYRQANDDEMSLFNWHLANLEYANAELLSKLSLAFWDQDDLFDMGGDHCFLHGGNGRLVEALTENVPILYEETVNAVNYGNDGVQVITGKRVFKSDMALCTVPLGILKNSSIKFVPELPQRKLDGIKRLGFGLLNKVALLFPHVFWGTDIDIFGHLTDEPSRRGEYFLFYSYAAVVGGPLLIALLAGEAARKFEVTPPTDAVASVLQVLRGIYEPQGVNVPDPVQTVCTRWGSDPFSLGSYSNIAVGSSGDDYDILAESVGDGKLFFAGEATIRRYPATMHGAFLSGLREAANILSHTNARASRKKIHESPLNDAYSRASVLNDLFREPDLRFGCFSVIYRRDDPGPESGAVLRVSFNELKRKFHDVLHPDKQLRLHFNRHTQPRIYFLLTKEQALQLREVRGGDEMRLFRLTEEFGVKLMDRKGFGPNADSVIASIKADRSNRKLAAASLASASRASNWAARRTVNF